MKTKKIATLAITVLAVAIFATAAYCFLGGADPSRNMGNYRSFSFYADRPGNATAIWMQPGALPPNPWDEFWFDNSGRFNLPGGLNTPGPVRIGTTFLTANTLAELTANKDSSGTVYLTSSVTLTGNLTTTCGLRPINGAIITTPSWSSVGTVANPSLVGAGTVTASGTPSATITFSSSADCNAMSLGTTITVSGTSAKVTNLLGSNQVTISAAETWSGASFTYTPPDMLVLSSATDYANLAIGSPLTANGTTKIVTKLDGDNTVEVGGGPVDWYNGGSGYSFTSQWVLTIDGPFQADVSQHFSGPSDITPASVIFGPQSVQGVDVDWFGDNASPGTTDMGPAINAAANAAREYAISVMFGTPATYYATESLNFTSANPQFGTYSGWTISGVSHGLKSTCIIGNLTGSYLIIDLSLDQATKITNLSII